MLIFKSLKKLPPFLKKVLLLGFVAIMIFSGWFVWSSFVPIEQGDSYTMNYSVADGATFNQILKDLEQVQMIRSYQSSKILQTITGLSLKKGEYTLSPSMSTWKILKTLSEGKPLLLKLTIPEGFSIQDIARRLHQEGYANAQDFAQVANNPDIARMFGIPASSVEGFLFPSTYHVPQSITSLDLIKLMIKTFFQQIEPFHNPSDSIKDIYSKVILASIVEKEAVVSTDRPIIASVFLNRIRKGMRLESCATIIYIFETRGVKKNRVYFKDLQVDSPYNTYRRAGLPPTPIANPGVASLKAAFLPAHTDYLFFAYKGNGEHIFSNNYEDHMRVYREYIQFQNIKKT